MPVDALRIPIYSSRYSEDYVFTEFSMIGEIQAITTAPVVG